MTSFGNSGIQRRKFSANACCNVQHVRVDKSIAGSKPEVVSIAVKKLSPLFNSTQKKKSVRLYAWQLNGRDAWKERRVGIL
jgi:hypothetical protein